MRKLGLIAILSLVSLTSGCLAAAGVTVGAAGVLGYVYYDKNEAQRDFHSTFEKTWAATLRALRDLKYTVPKDPEHLEDFGELTIDNLTVRVARHPGNSTRVSIRIGTFDTENHRRSAGLIIEKIEAGL